MRIKVRHAHIRKICFLQKESETSLTAMITCCGFKKKRTFKIEFEFLSFKSVIILSKNIKQGEEVESQEFYDFISHEMIRKGTIKKNLGKVRVGWG